MGFLDESKALFYAQAKPPIEALNTIGFGKLKGKSDISPQWRIEALTATYGLYGEGWYYKIIDKNYQPVEATGEVMIFITVELYTKNLETGEWRMPAVGCGGDFLIISDKNGTHGNDEAEAMCLTDALGKAAKNLGIANDIYRGKFDTKYNRWKDDVRKEKEEVVRKNDEKMRSNENYRIIGPDNVEIKTSKGWKNLEDLTLAELEQAIKYPPLKDVEYFIQTRIDLFKGSK